MKASVFLHSASNPLLHISPPPTSLLRASSRNLLPQACNSFGPPEYSPGMNTRQHDAVGNPGSPSTVIPPTPAPRRGRKLATGELRRSNRSSTQAATAKMAPPARIVPTKRIIAKPSPATANGSPKRKIEEPLRSEDYDPYFYGPEGAPKAPNPTEGSPSKRARRADVVVVEYHGKERRPRPWRDSPPDSYLDRVDRINRTRYVVISDGSILL